VAQLQEFFYGWVLTDWVVFAVYFVAAFGLLNGVYSMSRLIRKGNLPTVYWVLNGVLAGTAALLAASPL